MRADKKGKRKKKKENRKIRKKNSCCLLWNRIGQKIGGGRNVIQEPLGYIAKSKKEIKSNK